MNNPLPLLSFVVGCPENGAAIDRYLRSSQSLSSESIDAVYVYYVQNYSSVPGAPAVDRLQEDDAFAASGLCIFKPEEHVDWNGLKAHFAKSVQEEADAINPFMPGWVCKDPMRPPPWVGDSGDCSPQQKADLNNLIRSSTPARCDTVGELFSTPPTNDIDHLGDVAMAMGRLAPLFAWPLGDERDDNAIFRWAPALCLIGGLCPSVLRVFAACMQEVSAWQHWQSQDDESISKDILEAHRVSGYPAGLLRCDALAVLRPFWRDETLVNALGQSVLPRWMSSLLALHILKHVRVYPGAAPEVFVAYQGLSARIPIPPESMTIPLSSRACRSITNLLCQSLRLPIPGANKNPTVIDKALLTVLNHMRLDYLPMAQPLAAFPLLIQGPHIIFGQQARIRSTDWVQPGLQLFGVAQVDPESGRVDREPLTGTQLYQVIWKPSSGTLLDVMNWGRALPTSIQPKRFSDTLRAQVRNLDTLGHSEGMAAILDACVTASLYGSRLSSESALGKALGREHPLIWALPMSADVEDSTNNGKTTLVRFLAETLVSGLGNVVTASSTSTSPPAQRSMAEPLYRFGTAIYDEFQIPPSREHFLNQAGLQSLATGGTVVPGRAMENDPGVRLHHPLFLAAKVVKIIPDICNRSVMCFLSPLTKQNRCSADELEALTDGSLAGVARLAHVLWCEQRGMGTSLNDLPIHPSEVWRFPGLLAIARQFADLREINAYLAQATERVRQHALDAEETGLAESVGVGGGFSPQFYLESASAHTVGMLHLATSPIRLTNFMRQIIENGGERRFDSALRNVSEASAGRQFSEYVKQHCTEAGEIEIGNLRFRYYTKRDAANPCRDAKGRSVACFMPVRTPVSGAMVTRMPMAGRPEEPDVLTAVGEVLAMTS